MENEIISYRYIVLIVTAVILGSLARILTLKLDYRQYPSFPNGYLTHLVTGVIAAALGAVAVPALMTKNYTAITFLSLAIQQFRDVRKTEKNSLKSLEKTEYTKRGSAYIDGITKTFEARNYFSLLVSLTVGIVMQLVNNDNQIINIIWGTVGAIIVFMILERFSKGKTIGEIADIKLAQIEVKNSEVYVNGVHIAKVEGNENSKVMFQEEGLAAIITPYHEKLRVTLDTPGQRQAMIFEVCRALGVKRYHFIKRDYRHGSIIIGLIPIIKEEKTFLEIIKKTPLLESVKKDRTVIKKPLKNSQFKK